MTSKAAVVPEEVLDKATDENIEKEKTADDPKIDDEAAKKRRQRRRLSFADEHGNDITEVSYHNNLHYSPVKSPDDGKSRGGGTGCGCIIS
jgi:hypothetical protein